MSSYLIGFGRADITPDVKGIGMMGWGYYPNKVEGVETPICARAMVLQSASKPDFWVWVNAEICFITTAIKAEVVARLNQRFPEIGYNNDTVFLTAQHTHSAPGGYSYHGIYNVSIPGFISPVFEKYVEGIIAAIEEAMSRKVPAEMRMATGNFPPEQEVAFNRSLRPFFANPETQNIPQNQRNLAVDREMTVLRVDDLEGKPLGMISWFGVHTTNVLNYNKLISPDNKGYASLYFEEKMQQSNPDFVAAFAQSPCGDIIANFIHDSKIKRLRGKFPDMFESARYNGHLQYEKAWEVYQKAENETVIEGEIDALCSFYDIADVEVDANFSQGKTNCKTGAAALGVAFFAGTKEGPGVPELKGLLDGISKLVQRFELKFSPKTQNEHHKSAITKKYLAHGKKKILVETMDKKMIGISNIGKVPIPAAIDKSIYYFKHFYRTGALSHRTWTPHILPLQIVRLGSLVLAGIPAEPTTVSGWRMKAQLQTTLAAIGVKNVLIAPYANAYSGYITTYEEYQIQNYEGGHTLFGEWTLGAYQTCLKLLAEEMQKEKEQRFLHHFEVPPFVEIEDWKSPELKV